MINNNLTIKTATKYDWTKFEQIRANLEQIVIKNKHFLSEMKYENKYISS